MTDHDVDVENMIGDSVRRLFSDSISSSTLESFERGEQQDALWKLLIDSGLHDALVPPDMGGVGATFEQAYAIFHAVGFYQAPVPLIETIVARYFASSGGMPLSDGVGTMLDVVHARGVSVSGATQAQAQWVLSGTAREVPWARQCDWALVCGDDGQGFVRVDLGTAQVSIAKQHNIALEPRDTITFSDAITVECATQGWWSQHDALFVHMALAKAIALTGALEAALSKTVAYVNERAQFGRPLGKFQAIQHALAEVAGLVASARMAAKVAARTASQWPANEEDIAQQLVRLRFDTAVAKVRAGQAATRTAAVVHQLHGAIGFTQEYSLHYITKRLWAWRSEFGSDAWWAQRLGQAAIRAGGQGFWPALTSRSLDFSLDSAS